MAQIIRKSTNSFARPPLAGFVLFKGGFFGGTYAGYWSPYTTDVHNPRALPIPFSHQHHVAGLGIDCRYCHTTVETSSFAGVPPTNTSMSCHSQIWNDSPMLQPVRNSLANNTPIAWKRVYILPDYVYFNHSIHVAKGVA